MKKPVITLPTPKTEPKKETPLEIAARERQERYSQDALAKAAQRRQNRAKRPQGVTAPSRTPPPLRGTQSVTNPDKSIVHKTAKIRRNSLCSCGSGKKNKKCCDKTTR